MTSAADRDIYLGAFIIVVSLAMLFVVIPAGVDSPAEVPILALAPSFWPNVVVIFLGVVGFIILVQGFTSRRAVKTPDADSATANRLPFSPATARVAVAVALLFAYYWLLKLSGFVAASVAAIVAFTLLSGERRYWIFVPVAVLLPVTLYYFFSKVANIYLPLGVLEGWL
ncbi:MAG: tripartite tricarboxylate transporter TctB family protein [Gammaproteobacteria bacterium]